MLFDDRTDTVRIRVWPLRAHILSTESGWAQRLVIDVASTPRGFFAEPRQLHPSLAKRGFGDVNLDLSHELDIGAHDLGPRHTILSAKDEPVRALLPEVTCLNCSASGAVNVFLHIDLSLTEGIEGLFKETWDSAKQIGHAVVDCVEQFDECMSESNKPVHVEDWN